MPAASPRPAAQRPRAAPRRGSKRSPEHRIVHRDRSVRVSEGLQHADLFALGADQTRNDDVQEERATAAKMNGVTVPMFASWASSFSRYHADVWSFREYAPSPPYRARIWSTLSMTPGTFTSRPNVKTTSLNAPSRSNAAARSRRRIQNTPNRLSSGKRSPPRIE